MAGERTNGRRKDKWQEKGQMAGERINGRERTNGRRKDKWQEKGQMAGERTNGRRKDKWQEKGQMAGERTHAIVNRIVRTHKGNKTQVF
ncbi:hypothetical protein DPMN_113125 [Dreissena polymorpha]|uniref:Uncharacterized protein n=1 Tax=Dreissena polymorpha TaxID=45954 RepID=A0A9D4KGX6_DREPO|nr:hypothetical protein DPMN_113125 [Dreissena polymorpha]